MKDDTLQSIAERSLTYGPWARRVLAERVSGVRADTRTLRDLTAELEAGPLPAENQRQDPEDAALDELRERFGA